MTGTGVKGLTPILALSCTGPYKNLAVGACVSSDTPGGSPLGDKFLYYDLFSDMPGTDEHHRVSVERGNLRANLHNRGDVHKYLPGG